MSGQLLQIEDYRGSRVEVWSFKSDVGVRCCVYQYEDKFQPTKEELDRLIKALQDARKEMD